MEDKKINDDLFEAIIRQAVIKNHENELANIPSEMQLSKIYTFSERHNLRMKKLFKSYKWKQNINAILKYSKTAIITISIVTAIIFAGILSSAKAREVISQVIIEWFETFTKFSSSKSNESEIIENI